MAKGMALEVELKVALVANTGSEAIAALEAALNADLGRETEYCLVVKRMQGRKSPSRIAATEVTATLTLLAENQGDAATALERTVRKWLRTGLDAEVCGIDIKRASAA
jgi:hypothetical protein